MTQVDGPIFINLQSDFHWRVGGLLSGKTPTMAELKYGQLILSDVEQAAQMIAQAFVDDPLTSIP